MNTLYFNLLWFYACIAALPC